MSMFNVAEKGVTSVSVMGKKALSGMSPGISRTSYPSTQNKRAGSVVLPYLCSGNRQPD